jgi:hypothetical protein
MAGGLDGGNHGYSQRVIPLDSITGDITSALESADQVSGRGPLLVGDTVRLSGCDQVNTDHRFMIEPSLIQPVIGRCAMPITVDHEVSLAGLLTVHRPLRSDADPVPVFSDGIAAGGQFNYWSVAI